MDSTEQPKSLLPIGGHPLLKLSLTQLVNAGIERVVLVLGFHGQHIRQMIEAEKAFKEVKFDFIDLGDDWRDGFCPSLLKARDALKDTGEFILCTFDHIFEPSIIERMIKIPATPDGTTCLVDTSRNEPLAGSGDCTRLTIVGEERSVTKVNPPEAESSGTEAGLFKTTPSILDVMQELHDSKPYFPFSAVLQELSSRGSLYAMPTEGALWFAIENFQQLSSVREHAATGAPLFAGILGAEAPKRKSFIAPSSSDPDAIFSLPERQKGKIVGRDDSLGLPRKINVCLVGLGRAGHFHMRSMAMLTDKVRLLWVVDVNEKEVARVANEFDCHGTADLDIPLNDANVDAVIVASTTFLHYEHIIRCLKAGKAVLAEKPISHDPAELQHVLDTAKEKKVPFLAGYQRRCDKNFRALRAELQSGHIGGIRVLKCTSRCARAPAYSPSVTRPRPAPRAVRAHASAPAPPTGTRSHHAPRRAQ